MSERTEEAAAASVEEGGAGASAGGEAGIVGASPARAKDGAGKGEGQGPIAGDGDPEGEEESDGADEEMEELRLATKFVEFRMSAINAHITCHLCGGYFRDAHTISECLHTFCKSCLFKQIAKGLTKCPHCEMELGPNPKDFIVADRQMQSLVDKLLPELEEQDQAMEVAFYQERGIALKPEFDPSSSAAHGDAREAKRPRRSLPARKEMNVKLVPDTTCPAARKLEALAKPFLRTSCGLLIQQLQKYLQKKLCLSSEDAGEAPAVELLCNGEVLGTELSLQFVEKTRWIDTSPTLELQYRLRAT